MKILLPTAALLALFGAAHAQTALVATGCAISPSTVAKIQAQLAVVVNLSDDNGGIFRPNMMWSAIVDRAGRLCSVIKTGDAWPGSREIAIAKATTANGFSNSSLSLSTSNLYAPTQPGGSLYGLNNSNPFNPVYLQNDTTGHIPGGIITFGGGMALYDSKSQVIGGLGVSGDSSCADHAIAFRMRKLAGYDTLPGGNPASDNIIYGPPYDGSQQPHCYPKDLTPQQVIDIPAH